MFFSISFFLSAHAQIKKKSILLGGQIAFVNSSINYSTMQSNQKEKDAAFNISIGKAIKDNSVYGINISYQPSTIKNFFNGAAFINQKVNQYSFGAFYRQYKSLSKDFYFFIQPEADYIIGKNM